MVPTPAAPATEAHKTEPDKNTYLVFKQGPRRAPTRRTTTARTSSSRATRAASPARLHHAHQPRRRRRTPRDAARDARTPTVHRSRRSTARPGTRGRSGSCSRPRTRTHRRTPPRPDYPSTVERRLRRARPRRLRGHPGRLRREHLDRRGHRRLEQAGHGRAKLPNSFVYRYVPAAAGRPAQRQARGAAGAARRRRPDHAGERSRRSTVARPDGAAHVRQGRSTRAG